MPSNHRKVAEVAVFIYGMSHPMLDAMSSRDEALASAHSLDPDTLLDLELDQELALEPLGEVLAVDVLPKQIGCRKAAQLTHRQKARVCPVERRRPSKSRVHWHLQLSV